MVLTRSFLVSVPSDNSSSTELENSLMLLPVGDLFNHGAQSISRTRYDPERDSITIVTKTAFQEGEEVVSALTRILINAQRAIVRISTRSTC
jgi:hypothetical protein